MNDYKEVRRRVNNAVKEIVKTCIEDREQQDKPLSKAKIRQLEWRVKSAIWFGEGFNEEYWVRYQIILDYKAKLKRLYNSAKWKRFRQRWLQYHPACVCGETDTQQLVIHHVDPRKVFFTSIEKKTPKEIQNIKDFTTLCRACHINHEYGYSAYKKG